MWRGIRRQGSRILRAVTAERWARRFGSYGQGAVVGMWSSEITYPERVFVGAYVSIGPRCFIYAAENAKVVFGKGTIVGPLCRFISSNHNCHSPDLAAIPYDNA